MKLDFFSAHCKATDVDSDLNTSKNDTQKTKQVSY